MKRIGIVTSESLIGFAADDKVLVERLLELGCEVVPAVWGEALPDNVNLFIVRSTWDYHFRPESFAAWLKSLDPSFPIINDPRLMLWNMNKKYLLELASEGLPVVESLLIPRGEAAKRRSEVREFLRGREAVIKPAISASAHQTRRVNAIDDVDVNSWFVELNETADVLVQPFLDGITSRGELSLVAIDGNVTHAYLKTPKLGDFRVQRDFGGASRTVASAPWHQEIAERFLRASYRLSGVCDRSAVSTGRRAAYARIDLVPIGSDEWVLGELELIEPALYFAASEKTVERFSRLVLHRCVTPSH